MIILTKPGEYQTTFPKAVIWPFTELIAHHIASMNYGLYFTALI
jgi:hypothetical protein